MAKRIYIGSSSSSIRIQKLYIGINGSAKSIIKGYIGESGMAKQFYPQHGWNKYTVNTTSTYTETRGSEILIDRTISRGGFGSWTCYSGYTFNNNNGSYSYNGSVIVRCSSGTTSQSSRYYNGCEVTKTVGNRRYESGGENWVYYSEIYGKQMGSQLVTTESRGDFVEFVTNDNSNAFPENGKHSDGYWYVKL